MSKVGEKLFDFKLIISFTAAEQVHEVKQNAANSYRSKSSKWLLSVHLTSQVAHKLGSDALVTRLRSPNYVITQSLCRSKARSTTS